MATGYVIFDLTAMYGNAKYVPPTALPRDDKIILEVGVPEVLLQSVTTAEGTEITGIRHNPEDPPDVWFNVKGQTIGLEITELLPENRFERDAIVRQIKARVLDKLKPVGTHGIGLPR